jgi:ketosteroid isomerase-like protein
MVRVTIESPTAAVREWFDALGTCCASEDYEGARGLIAEDVRSFGTKAEIVTGREKLEANQWRGIWPNIADFRFDLDTVVAEGEDGRAWGAVVWQSTGFDEDGEPFDRPGRATVVLERREDAWVAVHTHFSLYPGTPQFTYGPDGRDGA